VTGEGGTRVGLAAVIIAVTEERPRVLVVRRSSPASAGREPGDPSPQPESLPAGPFDPGVHISLNRGVRDWVREQADLDINYVEQLYTFGNRYRDPDEFRGGPRLLTVAYLALTHEAPVAGSGRARWRDCYGLLPWEDWRTGRPPVLSEVIGPALERWSDAAGDPSSRLARRERSRLLFDLETGAKRDPVLALERYELLYESGLVLEALRDREARAAAEGTTARIGDDERATAGRLGQPMAGDDRRIIAAALARLRGKLAYRPLVFDLLPAEFTLLQLQRVVEALAGLRLHKQNFRRMVMHAELVEATGRTEATSRGRPAELYRFRRDITRVRSVVGVGLTPARPAG
jgi:hypothetical protein